MNSFDEKQPEEQDPEYEELLTLLQHANLDAMFVDPQEQAQTLSKVRARLFPTAHEIAQPDAQQMPEPGSLPSNPRAQRRPHRSLIHLINVIAAVLVVALLIGSSLLLFGPWSPLRQDRTGTGPPVGPVGTQTLIYYGGKPYFPMQLELTPGPYFVGELLEADLLIYNQSHTTYWLTPEPTSTCPEMLKITTTGGGSPYASDVQRNWNGLPDLLKCSSPLSRSLISGIRVSSHQTITIKQYVQLTSSGHVTLAAQLAAIKVTNEHGASGYIIPASTPLTHLQLHVSSLVPSDRQLFVKEQKTQVVVSGPLAIRDQLLGEWATSCTQAGRGVSGPFSIPGIMVTAMPPPCIFAVTTLTVFDKRLWWVYVVGAPGYALVSGRVNG